MRLMGLAVLLALAIALAPIAGEAQQTGQIRRIGVLMGLGEESDPRGQARVAAFREGLQTLGWAEGRNIRIRHPLGDDVRRGADATIREGTCRAAARPHSFA
jgi:putative tryptophan/tyrosine transport system substrate-binding protein